MDYTCSDCLTPAESTGAETSTEPGRVAFGARIVGEQEGTNAERGPALSILLIIIIVVVVLLLLGFFGYSRR